MKNDYKDVLPKDDNWHKEIKKGVYLTDYQIRILRQNGININNSINGILMEVNEILSSEENEQLELVAKEIDEMNYYNSQKN